MEITQNFLSKLDFFSELQVHIANLHMHFSNPSLDQHIKKKKKRKKKSGLPLKMTYSQWYLHLTNMPPTFVLLSKPQNN